MKYKSFITCIFYKNDLSILKQFLENLDHKYKIEAVWDHAFWEAPQEYIEEMGAILETRVIILSKSLNIEKLANLKKYLMMIEEEISQNGERILNLNPGYLSDKGMYLLTHKSNEERGREQISERIWQEKQYDFKGKFLTNKNTFSEYSGKVKA